MTESQDTVARRYYRQAFIDTFQRFSALPAELTVM